MTGEEYRSAVLDAVYLASCAVNGQAPERVRAEQMDTQLLLEAADIHSITGIAAMALESAGVRDEAFTQARGKALRKAAVLDMERAAVLAKLEEAGIWHMPLKGSVLQGLYPKFGMRQMADVDILFDSSKAPEARAVMEGLGFTALKSPENSITDHYYKEPVCNFEFHRSLFKDGRDDPLIVNYYRDVKSRLIPDEGGAFGYHFSDEDFYIYMLAHEFKHFSGGGTGIRSLLDTYVFLKNREDTLDRSYISGELEKLGIADFEARNRSLSLHLFGAEALTGEDSGMLDYIMASGTYGTVSNRIKNRIRRYGDGALGRLRYVGRRVILPLDTVRTSFPLFIKCPVLLPFLPAYRLLRGLTVRRRRMKAELGSILRR